LESALFKVSHGDTSAQATITKAEIEQYIKGAFEVNCPD